MIISAFTFFVVVVPGSLKWLIDYNLNSNWIAIFQKFKVLPAHPSIIQDTQHPDTSCFSVITDLTLLHKFLKNLFALKAKLRVQVTEHLARKGPQGPDKIGSR